VCVCDFRIELNWWKNNLANEFLLSIETFRDFDGGTGGGGGEGLGFQLGLAD
jgi:hypothetical protein